MTVGAFILVLISIFFMIGWLLIIYVMNLYAGYPYWELVMDMFWPVGAPALIFLLTGVLLQVSYLRKKRKGVPSESLPATIPAVVYPLLAGLLLGGPAIRSLKYSYYPLSFLLFVLSFLCFAMMAWLIRNKK